MAASVKRNLDRDRLLGESTLVGDESHHHPTLEDGLDDLHKDLDLIRVLEEDFDDLIDWEDDEEDDEDDELRSSLSIFSEISLSSLSLK